jgi:hypothetical protein
MKQYWLDRQQDSLALAVSSSNPEGSIAHTELARRFGIEAGHALVRKLANVSALESTLALYGF